MNKLALVTGGARGIGREISIALKNAGYDVAATYCRNKEEADSFTGLRLPQSFFQKSQFGQRMGADPKTRGEQCT